jgi:hypothetical protein
MAISVFAVFIQFHQRQNLVLNITNDVWLSFTEYAILKRHFVLLCKKSYW